MIPDPFLFACCLLCMSLFAFGSNLAVTGLTRYALLEAELLRRVIPLALPWKKSKIPDALEMQVSYLNISINMH
jgi:hypothetical protein